MLKTYNLYSKTLAMLPETKLLIATLNAHSYNVSKKDKLFQVALQKSDVLIPDGISIVFAMKWLKGQSIQKIAGADLFFYEMQRLNTVACQADNTKSKVFFLGSTDETLEKITKRAAIEFPTIQIETYSPPYKSEFSKEDNEVMLEKINAFKPAVLFVGMTAPKQEKWAYQHFNQLQVGHVCSIGAVFDFYAGTVQRAPQWMIGFGLEWLYRLLSEPKRMWRRYLIGNTQFVYYVVLEKLQSLFQKKAI